MALIDGLVLDGTVAVMAIAILGLELLAILLFKPGAPRLPLLANALSGLFLILALRAALIDAGALWIALFLALGFAAHLGDLVGRLRS
ncbi:hypothetical protein [Aureimonas sp. SA4125]|uniref:hypothetical protein n=1 Tax=Aureimonas sp. SA4125 TaxID=2826993 RepID=UPI001CC4FB8D|nr:hypothetical protein [Aureimonas sp. SA4125]